MQSAYWRRDRTGRTVFWIQDDGLEVFRCARWDVVVVFLGSQASSWTVTEIGSGGLELAPHALGSHARSGRGLAELFIPVAGASVFVAAPNGQETLFDCVEEKHDTLRLIPHAVPVTRSPNER